MYDLFYANFNYYIRAAVGFWRNMGPYEYGGILTFVAVVGWLMMRGQRR
jgi:hypothetical protein